jgi:hypothetical protein
MGVLEAEYCNERLRIRPTTNTIRTDPEEAGNKVLSLGQEHRAIWRGSKSTSSNVKYWLSFQIHLVAMSYLS